MSLPLPLPITAVKIKDLEVTGSLTGGGSSGAIGLPPDGVFGITNPFGIDETDSHALALDKIAEYVELTSDVTPPPDLNTFVLTLVDALYDAYASGGSTVYTDIQNNNLGKPVTNIIGPFGGAEAGTLTAYVKNTTSAESAQGQITLTANDDTGINNYIEITKDDDPYAGIPGKEGLFKALEARIGPGSVTLIPGTTQYSFRMEHSSTAVSSTPTLSFYQDDAYNSAPSVTNATINSITTSGTTYVSGLKLAIIGDTISVSFQAINCVKKFYNRTWTGRVSGDGIAELSALPTGLDRNEGASPIFNLTPAINANVYYENFTTLFEVRNSANTTASVSGTSTIPIRIDTKSLNADNTPTGFVNELPIGTVGKTTFRIPSGVGQYPNLSIVSYDSTQSLVVNEELQLLGGLYQYPPLVDYSATLPTGNPTYTVVSGGTYLTYRWATFYIGNVVNVNSITFTIHGQVNFGTDVLIPDCAIYIKIIGVTGWLDANSSYPGLGDPINDGDPCLDNSTGASTVSIRRCSLGSILGGRTGDVLVRLGIPSNSIRAFIGITF